METVKSKNNIPIRMTAERWVHIVENHDDLAGYYEEILETVENPDFVVKGYKGALFALKRKEGEKFLAVVYKEINENDGFIITAYFTNKIKIEEEEIIWQQQQ